MAEAAHGVFSCGEAARPTIETERLIEALRDPGCYRHPVDKVELIETHVSWVLLAGEYAYKIKKPLDLGFLDFSTLQARRHFCEEEIRLNARLAPQLYLQAVPVLLDAGRPHFGVGSSPDAIEYAVRMRRFRVEDELGALADRGELTVSTIASLARVIARFHRQAEVARPGEGHGDAHAVMAPCVENFDQLAPMAIARPLADRLEALRAWTLDQFARLEPIFTRRLAQGQVRECHGDLHLANIVLYDGEPVPFDALEFSARLRWIDTINEIAFTVMDLHQRRQPALARRFLDEYLAGSGDYDGVALLAFYLVYRAMVRAKIAAIRAEQLADPAELAAGLIDPVLVSHLELAERFAAPHLPALVLTHGVSGCGKSRAALRLLEQGDWIRLRSDVERKRLAGMQASDRSGSAPMAGLYRAQQTQRTYDRLLRLADGLLRHGQRVIVDATFLTRAQRQPFLSLANSLGVGVSILAPQASRGVLESRIKARLASGNDPSEADTRVLAMQLDNMEPLSGRETELALSFDSQDANALNAALAEIERRTEAPPGGDYFSNL